ncbi:HD-GYP domain-containing protein [Methylotenera sp.]|uniref:HD-GYP domain-containing protein n=1 Tax=Methylotenera sp. TaxID=2051956 RepID=UPI0024885004|nr:HD-GYP domain-containing protein [Methylotenera sp.]MDI1298208.1 HD-GYP domain-containing protein [Methylotenera sp.]
MTDIRREKTLASLLDIGMFVCELDRPWLGTPFMLEGLLIEDDEQITTIASLCEFVYVDRTVSVGLHFRAAPKEQVAIKRDGTINRVTLDAYTGKQTSNAINKTTKLGTPNVKFSFVDILKEIHSGNQAALSGETKSTNSDAVFKVQYITDNKVVEISADKSADNTTLATQIKTDFSNFISGLTSWGGKQKKLKSNIDKNTLKTNLAKSEDRHDGDKITIFDEAPPVEDEIAAIYPIYEKSQLATKEMFEALALDHEIDLTKIHEALDGMVESIERNPDALLWLAKLKQTDDYSYNHAMSVSITLMALANFMSLPKKQVKDLGLAGLLQDIGKAKIPTDLLHKLDKITHDEFEILKKHVEHALALLEATENISSTVILTVSQHHERIDGSGYPYKLSGNQISLTGQMAGLVDTYCALTTNKVYAKGVYNQIALEEIHSLRGFKFNGVLIDQLVQFLGMYPVSSLVELNSGEVGVVIQQNSVRRLLPRIMILLNPDKTRNEYPAIINLINSPLTASGEPYKIVRGLPPDSYGLSANNYYA